MRMMIHDLNKEDYRLIFPADPEDCRLIGPDKKVRPCIGCEDCWVRMPGECPIRDDAGLIARDLSSTDEIIILTRCCYGSVSPFIKAVLDRMTGYQLPFAEVRDGETRFRLRYDGRIRLRVIFYGDISSEEKRVASDYIERVGKAFNASKLSCDFAEDVLEMGGMI